MILIWLCHAALYWKCHQVHLQSWPCKWTAGGRHLPQIHRTCDAWEARATGTLSRLLGLQRWTGTESRSKEPIEQIRLSKRATGCFRLIREIVSDSVTIGWESAISSPEIPRSLNISRQVVEKSPLGWSESGRDFVPSFVVFVPGLLSVQLLCLPETSLFLTNKTFEIAI